MNVNSRKLTFDTCAELYHDIRPGYPSELFRDIVTLSGLPSKGSILEIGCGTGQATQPLADMGYRMVCLDIGSNLAAIAENRFKNHPNVRVLNTSFEEWNAPNERFHLVMSATAFHWIDPHLKYTKSSAILHDSGCLAIFRNTHAGLENGFFGAVQPLYRKYAPELYNRFASVSGRQEIPVDLTEEIARDGRFTPVSCRTYCLSVSYSAQEYIKLLSTYSDHILLNSSARTALLQAIAELIHDRYNGHITKDYRSVLNLALKKPPNRG